MAPLPEYHYLPHKQKFGEAEGDYHGASSYQPSESPVFFLMTYRIILDPTLSEEDLGKIWGLDHGQRLGLDADPTTGQAFGWTLEEIGWETYPPKF